jgi:predicted ATPase
VAIREGSNTRIHLTGIYGALSEALVAAGEIDAGLVTMSQVISLVEETGEHYYEAELYRLLGGFQVKQGNDRAAEESLRNAVEVARRQSAKSFELRAIIDLARLLHLQGRSAEVRTELSDIYGWFTEGFDTDLIEAESYSVIQCNKANGQPIPVL